MIETKVENPEKVETITADSQGRVSLGIEYAAKDVEIIVVNSETAEAESASLQGVIGDRPMTEYERSGMLFVRAFGISKRFLKDDHTADTDEDGRIDSTTVGPIDIDWSYGLLLDPKHVARFNFEKDAGEEQSGGPIEEKLTVVPQSVTEDEHGGDPVYRYENDQGDTSAITQRFVDKIQQIFGYDPVEDLTHVRVAPDKAPMPVMFCDPETDVYVAIAPRVEER